MSSSTWKVEAKPAVVEEMEDVPSNASSWPTSNLSHEIGQLRDQLNKLMTTTAKAAGKKPN